MDWNAMRAAVNGALYESGWCQRTTAGKHSWRHVSEGGFDQRRYRVVPLDHTTAQRFVVEHHYSGSYPRAKKDGRWGLVERDELVGVAVLGGPMRDEVITNALPTLDRHTGAELSRLVLLDRVPANAESWFATRVLREALANGIRGVVAFSDPVPRPDVDMPGHVGTIYQAMGAAYCKRATSGPMTVLPDGTVLTRRTVQKVRAWERGAGGVVRRLVACGAPVPLPGEPGGAYLKRALAQVDHTTVAHPGNHRFVFRLGRTERQRRAIPLGFDTAAYPKTPDLIHPKTR